MSPREPLDNRTIRITKSLWEAAKEIADLRGDNLSAEIRKFLERYVKKGIK